jgi:hypothetical protein
MALVKPLYKHVKRFCPSGLIELNSALSHLILRLGTFFHTLRTKDMFSSIFEGTEGNGDYN